MAHTAVSESQLWSTLNDQVQAAGVFAPTLDWERIENSCGAGHPDVAGVYRGNAFWIELKTEALPKRESTTLKTKFEPGQIPWMKARDRALPGSCWIIAQFGSGRGSYRYLIPIADYLLLYEGASRVELEPYRFTNALEALDRMIPCSF